MPRLAELTLVTPDGALLGCLPPVPVATPWWNDAEAVVNAAREHHGIEIVTLRLLSAQSETPHDPGVVTYLAETSDACNTKPWHGALTDHKLRRPFAKPGGPAADLAWADRALAAQGYVKTAPPVQMRSWNLSSLWRIAVKGETLWLKLVPDFFAHEGRLLEKLAGAPVPKVIAQEGNRLLLAEIAGEDFYQGATTQQLQRVISILVEIQSHWIGKDQQLLSLGLPDAQLPAIEAAAHHVLDTARAELSLEDIAALQNLIDHMPRLARDIDACGLPPTLVHGDFHSGNMRGQGLSLTLLDWGDSCVGHPLLDQAAMLRHQPEIEQEILRIHWHGEWQRRIPGSDPARASELLRPIAALKQAIGHQQFLDNSEPAEHKYHRGKPALWLRRAAELYRD